MKKYFKRAIIFIVFVVAIGGIYLFRNCYGSETNQLHSGLIGSILAAIFAAFLAWVAWEQLSKINTTSSADFIHKLTKD